MKLLCQKSKKWSIFISLQSTTKTADYLQQCQEMVKSSHRDRPGGNHHGPKHNNISQEDQGKNSDIIRKIENLMRVGMFNTLEGGKIFFSHS